MERPQQHSVEVRRALRQEVAQLGGALAAEAPEEIRDVLSGVVDLAAFRASARGTLSLRQRRLIVDQALLLIEQNYVHLPLKAAMHAVDPVQRLRLLRARLERQSRDDLTPEIDFHRQMSEIFHSVRDLHTNYLLPRPFAGKVAFLPFMVEEFWDGPVRRYQVTRTVTGFQAPGFGPGVEITHWNGMTVERAVEANAARYAGSNEAARHARGVESLTVRPLRIHLPPNEDWVVVGYIDGAGQGRELRQSWLVVENLPPMTGDALRVSDTETALGLDLDGDETGRARKLLFAQPAAASEISGVMLEAAGDVPTTMSAVFRARAVDTASGRFGHIRIFTFNVDDPAAFVFEFVRLAEALPQDGLIIDVRGNGGGHIWAAEFLLQTLGPRTVVPEPVEFISTAVNLELCRQHEHGEGGIDLGPWVPSLEQTVETGAVYSHAFPITPPEGANAIGQRYHGPVVLITDARCYSATDIFAAGFKDHGIGEVIGVDPNTGAGGANVWDHGLLRALHRSAPGSPSPYKELPAGVGMRVSIRRTLRVGPAAGTPLEDLGVRPDVEHRMTHDDLTNGNIDLLNEAGRVLAGLPVRRLDVTGSVDAAGSLDLQLVTRGLDRVDMFVDGRPFATADVSDGPSAVAVPSALGGLRLVVDGYAAGELVAARKLRLGPIGGGDWGVLADDAAVAAVAAGGAAVAEVVRFLVHAPGATKEEVEAAVEGAWDDSWRLEHLFGRDGGAPEPPLNEHYAVTGRLRGVEPQRRQRRAFEMAQELMRRSGFEVQPDLAATAFRPDEVDPGDEPATLLAGGGGSLALPGTENPSWALADMRVPRAWALPGGQGAGIVIGHPDTGYTPHRELDAGALDLDRDWDVLDDDGDALDPLKKSFFGLWGNPGHGTATGSVIVSREGAVVTGVAPGATLAPIRAITSVALVFDGNVARAIDYARRQGCHIISMSLGGVGFSSSLRAAIRAAIADGVIVLAASGNHVQFVVAPASYREVIAVAATNIEGRPWAGSSHGRAVDVSAPGESVHTARAKKGQPSTNTARSSGTSFAVAHVAGVAALWLAHHGRDTLIAQYGAGNLQRVFAHLVKSTARVPGGWWDSGQYGAGIVDAERLLLAGLPTLAGVPALDGAVPAALERLAAYLPGVSADEAGDALAVLLPGVPAGEHDRHAGEVAYLLAQDASIREGFTAVARSGAAPAGGGPAAVAAARLRASASKTLASGVA